jgi:tRNA pseudouridine38-40 synthase
MESNSLKRFQMVKTAFKVAYIGTYFYGFQRQPNFPTVEGELFRAFKKAGVMNDPNRSGYSIAGRTDRGVHSLGNVVSLKTDSEATINQINYYLPSTIQIIAKTEVPDTFKPRYADYRYYRYVFFKDPYDNRSLDLKRMQHASKIFEGVNNFQNFTKRCERTPIRFIKEMNISQNKMITVIDVIGQSFLWNMVRKMVQVITMVGAGKMDEEDITLLLNPDISASITPVPPEGLILMDVKYEDVDFTFDRYAKNNFFKTIKEEYITRRTIAAAEEEMIKDLKHP